MTTEPPGSLRFDPAVKEILPSAPGAVHKSKNGRLENNLHPHPSTMPRKDAA